MGRGSWAHQQVELFLALRVGHFSISYHLPLFHFFFFLLSSFLFTPLSVCLGSLYVYACGSYPSRLVVSCVACDNFLFFTSSPLIGCKNDNNISVCVRLSLILYLTFSFCILQPHTPPLIKNLCTALHFPFVQKTKQCSL